MDCLLLEMDSRLEVVTTCYNGCCPGNKFNRLGSQVSLPSIGVCSEAPSTGSRLGTGTIRIFPSLGFSSPALNPNTQTCATFPGLLLSEPSLAAAKCLLEVEAVCWSARLHSLGHIWFSQLKGRELSHESRAGGEAGRNTGPCHRGTGFYLMPGKVSGLRL